MWTLTMCLLDGWRDSKRVTPRDEEWRGGPPGNLQRWQFRFSREWKEIPMISGCCFYTWYCVYCTVFSVTSIIYDQKIYNHGNIESFRLVKTLKIMESNKSCLFKNMNSLDCSWVAQKTGLFRQIAGKYCQGFYQHILTQMLNIDHVNEIKINLPLVIKEC